MWEHSPHLCPALDSSAQVRKPQPCPQVSPPTIAEIVFPMSLPWGKPGAGPTRWWGRGGDTGLAPSLTGRQIMYKNNRQRKYNHKLHCPSEPGHIWESTHIKIPRAVHLKLYTFLYVYSTSIKKMSNKSESSFSSSTPSSPPLLSLLPPPFSPFSQLCCMLSGKEGGGEGH